MCLLLIYAACGANADTKLRPIQDMQGRIYLEQKAFVLGEPIFLGVELRNTSGKEILVAPPSSIGRATLPFRRYKRGQAGKAKWRVTGQGFKAKQNVICLRPGETRVWKVTLVDGLDELAVGSYTLDVRYEMSWGAVSFRRAGLRVKKDRVVSGRAELGQVAFELVQGDATDQAAFAELGWQGFSWNPDLILQKHPRCTFAQKYYRFCSGSTTRLARMMDAQKGFYLTDDAMMRLARVYHQEDRQQASGSRSRSRAEKLLKRLLSEYPDGDRAREARFLLKKGFE